MTKGGPFPGRVGVGRMGLWMKAWSDKTHPETQQRVKTGVVAGAVFLALLLLGGPVGVMLLTAILGLAMVWEAGQLFLELSDRDEKQKALLGLSWLVLFMNFVSPRSLVEAWIFSTLAFFLYFLSTASRHLNQLKQHFMEMVLCIFVVHYVVGLMNFFPLIRTGSGGLHWAVLLFVVVWSADTGAYFAGRKWGGAKIYPAMSPGKTWSGAWGGLAAGVVAALVYKLIFFRGLGVFPALLTGLLVSLFSQLGDFCESFLKRAFGVKDTSQLLPGHGGILDRFDGVLFALPMMYLCVKAFG